MPDREKTENGHSTRLASYYFPSRLRLTHEGWLWFNDRDQAAQAERPRFGSGWMDTNHEIVFVTLALDLQMKCPLTKGSVIPIKERTN